jgi:hypothetical protein
VRILDSKPFQIVMVIIVMLLVGFVVFNLVSERNAHASAPAGEQSASTPLFDQLNSDPAPQASASTQPEFELVGTDAMPAPMFAYSEQDDRFLTYMGRIGSDMVARYAIGDSFILTAQNVYDGLCDGNSADVIIDAMVHGNGITVRREHFDQTQVWKIKWLQDDARAFVDAVGQIYGCGPAMDSDPAPSSNA